jgi:hypothetical protein
MKIIIFVLAMIFTTSVAGEIGPTLPWGFPDDYTPYIPEEPSYTKEAKIAFITNAMQTGAQLDPIPYITYIYSTMNERNADMARDILSKYAICYIFWAGVIREELTLETVPLREYTDTANRALSTSKIFAFILGQSNDFVDSSLIPRLRESDIPMTSGAIAECTILDGVAAVILEEMPEAPEVPKAPKEIDI